MAFYEGIEAGDGAQDGTPCSRTLLVGVESGPVTFLGATPFGWTQVEAGLVVFGAYTAFGLAIVTRLVVDVAEVTARYKELSEQRVSESQVHEVLTLERPSSSSGGLWGRHHRHQRRHH